MARTATTERDQFEHAKANAAGWLSSIEDMLADLAAAEAQDRAGGADETEAGRRRIEESVLSVQVRGGWHSPGDSSVDVGGAEEYEILLTTGGPALRIFGRLDQHCQPESAELQMQDWGTPWTRYPAPEATLLSFAQVFWFGE